MHKPQCLLTVKDQYPNGSQLPFGKSQYNEKDFVTFLIGFLGWDTSLKETNEWINAGEQQQQQDGEYRLRTFDCYTINTDNQGIIRLSWNILKGQVLVTYSLECSHPTGLEKHLKNC